MTIMQRMAASPALWNLRIDPRRSASAVPPLNISAAMTMIPRKPNRNCGRNIQISPQPSSPISPWATSILPDLASRCRREMRG